MNKVGGFTLILNFNILVKTVQNWCKDRHVDQWNRIEREEISPYIHAQLILDKNNSKRINKSRKGTESRVKG